MLPVQPSQSGFDEGPVIKTRSRPGSPSVIQNMVSTCFEPEIRVPFHTSRPLVGICLYVPT